MRGKAFSMVEMTLQSFSHVDVFLSTLFSSGFGNSKTDLRTALISEALSWHSLSTKMPRPSRVGHEGVLCVRRSEDKDEFAFSFWSHLLLFWPSLPSVRVNTLNEALIFFFFPVSFQVVSEHH